MTATLAELREQLAAAKQELARLAAAERAPSGAVCAAAAGPGYYSTRKGRVVRLVPRSRVSRMWPAGAPGHIPYKSYGDAAASSALDRVTVRGWLLPDYLLWPAEEPAHVRAKREARAGPPNGGNLVSAGAAPDAPRPPSQGAVARFPMQPARPESGHDSRGKDAGAVAIAQASGRTSPADGQRSSAGEARRLPHRDPRLPPPGTVLRREYRGAEVVVTVRADGFETAGEVYGSLSGAARAAMGVKAVNGFEFFGLTERSQACGR